jgi:hypothetical protein
MIEDKKLIEEELLKHSEGSIKQFTELFPSGGKEKVLIHNKHINFHNADDFWDKWSRYRNLIIF